MRLESRWFRTSKIKEELSQARTGSERDSLAQSESSAKQATQSRFYTPIFGLNTCGRGQKGRLRHKRRHKTNGNRHSLSLQVNEENGGDDGTRTRDLCRDRIPYQGSQGLHG
jgi:hypothetical protein